MIERIPSCELRAGCLAIVLLCLGSSVGAGTLQTRFSTVTVHDLPIGRWTRVELAGGVPYTVENTSNRKVTVTLTPGRPFEPKSVGRGYEMIPDPKWITVKPAVLKLEPHSSGTAEVRLTIPDDPKYAGKRYEVWLMAKGAGPQFQVGLITRIRFNIVAEPTDRPPSKTDEKRKEQDPS